jgi:hypothetical protein
VRFLELTDFAPFLVASVVDYIGKKSEIEWETKKPVIIAQNRFFVFNSFMLLKKRKYSKS